VAGPASTVWAWPTPPTRSEVTPPASQAAEGLLPALPSRDAQRHLAVRLHHYRLTTGADTEIITWLDDHSRLALHASAHPRTTGPIVPATSRKPTDQHGYPASTLTDNGMVYTTRFAGGRTGRTGFEHELHRLRARAAPAGHRAEEQRAEPLHHLRQDPTLPTDPQEVARRPTSTTGHHRPATDPDRRLCRRLRPAPPAPVPAPPGHPRDRLRRPPQSHTQHRPQPRHPRPRPHRRDRQNRLRHSAPGRPPAPHRHRPHPRPNPRSAPGPRPARPHRPRRHRGTPARAHHRPHPRLPTHRTTTRTHPEGAVARIHESWVRAMPMSCDIALSG